MEAFWIIPLYIISPLIGVLLLVRGIKNKTYKTLYTAIGLLLIPLAHLALVSLFNLNIQNEIVGNYNVGKEKEILIIKDDKTFTLNKSFQYKNAGKGTWQIEDIDSPILILKFDSIRKGELWLEIEKSKKEIILKTMSWGNDISVEFSK